MGGKESERYFVFMDYDPEYERIRNDRTKRGAYELDMYLSRKHDELLANTLEHGSYKKTISLIIVDGFAVEITEDQANALRSANGVIKFTCKVALSKVKRKSQLTQQSYETAAITWFGNWLQLHSLRSDSILYCYQFYPVLESPAGRKCVFFVDLFYLALRGWNPSSLVPYPS
ncbi:hypothetical protein OIU85_029415 [Salix viminalis]|uniref:Inhibitor I9 domain-containing protein n=1 Tax=Salix viminalis TaxID=40686 RepID=A0A9Q0QBC4_SALVM|nr:hypothetical protein OIU85_029415 [Salix viminalis]